MPIFLPGGSGGGGGGLHFRDPPDNFRAATIAAARTARDTAFTSGGTLASVLDQFANDRSLAIIVGVTGATTNTFETYTGAPGAAYDNTAWVERTDAVEGNPGADGDDGEQGRFEIIIHTNASSTPTTPTGGSYDIDTNVLTPPTGWTEAPTAPGTGEDVYASQAVIDPKTQSGTVTPTWSVPVERSHLSAGLSHVETSADFTGDGTAGDALGAAGTLAKMLDLGSSPTQTTATFAYAAPTGYTAGGFLASGQFVQFEIGAVDSPDDSDAIIQVGSDTYTLIALGGIAVKLHELVDDTKYLAFGKSDVLLLIGPTDGSGRIVDVTDSSLPAPDADAAGKIYIDRRIPAAWMIHEVLHAQTPVMGSFGSYTSPRNSGDTFDLYRGAHGSDPTTVRVGSVDQNIDSRHLGAFYWNWRDGSFRVWTSTFNTQTNQFVYHWQTAHNPADRLVSGGTGVFIGHANTDADLLTRLPQDAINTSRTYVGVATNLTGNGVIHIRTFDNSTYVAAVGAFNVYDFVTIGLYGQTGSGGQTAAQVKAAIDAAVAALVGSAPSDRDTLEELSDAIDAGGSGRAFVVGSPTQSGGTFTYAEPTGWPAGNVPAGTLLYAGVGTYTASTASMRIVVGSDSFGVEERGTGTLTPNQVLNTDTSILYVLSGSTANYVGPERPVISQADAEAGTSGTPWSWSAIRVAQAIAAQGSGFQLRQGATAPGSSLGNDGDWYIRTSNGEFFEKVSGVWTSRYTDQVGAGGGLSQSQVDARIDTLALRRAQNLADLANAGTARSNLGLGTAAVVDTGTADGDVPVLDSSGDVAEGVIPISIARLDGPVFTGEPMGPTPPQFNDSQRFATTAFVKQDALQKDTNLSDVDNAASARGNLGVDGAGIVTLLQALTGGNRLDATALQLIADAIDTELGDTAWRTGGSGGLSESQVDARITALVAAYALLSGSITVSDLPTSVQNAVRSLSYNTTNPQRLSYTEVDGGNAHVTLSGLAALSGAVFTGAVSGITPTAAAHLSRKDYVDTADGLRALLTGATFTGAAAGVTPTADNHFATKAYVDGRTNMPTHTTDQYVAIKATNDFVAADFTGANGEAFDEGSSVATVPDTISGNVYFALARLDADPDATFLDIDSSGFNQIGGTTAQAATITINSSAYEVRVSNHAADYGGATVEYR